MRRFPAATESAALHSRAFFHGSLEPDLKTRLKMEGASLADFAVKPGTASDHLREPRRDGKPQASAPIPPRNRAIGLRKRLENRFPLLWPHTDARVEDGEPKLREASLLLDGLHNNSDLPLLR